MIIGKKVNLRPLGKKDIETTRCWINDPDVNKWLCPHFPISREEQKEWFEKLIRDTSKKKMLVETKKGIPIGLVSLMRIDTTNLNAEIGIFLGEKQFLRKGYAKDAFLTLLNFSFSKMGFYRIYLYVVEENIEAISFFESCGFIREGLLRGHVFMHGKRCNVIIMGLLKTEFKSRGNIK